MSSIDFNKENLNEDEIKASLISLKNAINHYEQTFLSKKIIFNGCDSVKFAIYDDNLPHLLGIDALTQFTWYDYIINGNIKNLKDLKKIADSYEFISYQILSNNQQSMLNYRKIMFKSDRFCKLDLNTSDYFFFKIKNNIHLARIVNDEVITFKLTKNIQNISIPISLYIYNIDDPDLSLMYNKILPNEMRIKSGPKKTFILKTDVENTTQKILKITNKKI